MLARFLPCESMGDPNSWANEIIPRLWLGNFQAATSHEWLSAHRIEAVFNCSKNIPFALIDPIRKYRIPLDDNLQAEEIRNARLWSFEAVYRVAAEYNSGAQVLIHCHAGMQRSACVVAMFLIFLTRCKPDEAINFIKSRRPVAFLHSINFKDAIYGFHDDYMRYIYEKGLALVTTPKSIGELMAPAPAQAPALPQPHLRKHATY